MTYTETGTQSSNPGADLQLRHPTGAGQFQTLNLDAVSTSTMTLDRGKAAFLTPSPMCLGLISMRKAALETQRASMRGKSSPVEQKSTTASGEKNFDTDLMKGMHKLTRPT